MINIINEDRDDAHIITIEDPIEYYHKHKKGVVTQREVNVDVPNFAEALKENSLGGIFLAGGKIGRREGIRRTGKLLAKGSKHFKAFGYRNGLGVGYGVTGAGEQVGESDLGADRSGEDAEG